MPRKATAKKATSKRVVTRKSVKRHARYLPNKRLGVFADELHALRAEVRNMTPVLDIAQKLATATEALALRDSHKKD